MHRLIQTFSCLSLLSITSVLRAEEGSEVSFAYVGSEPGCATSCVPCLEDCVVSNYCPGGFFLEGDFIYWKAIEDNLEFAEKIENSNIHRGELNFHWRPGVKAKVGYLFIDQSWDLSLGWTYLKSDAHQKFQLSDGQMLSTWFPFVLGEFAQTAEANWNVVYNVLDLEFGKFYSLGSSFIFHPQLGLRGVWIHQHYHAYYTSTLFPSSSGIRNKNNFDGFGIRMGADFIWPLSCHWDLVGALYASLIYGRFHLRENISGTQNLNIHSNFWRVRPNLESQIGLQWKTPFYCDQFLFTIGGFYDLVYWFSQNQMLDQSVVTVQTRGGDLQFQGGSLKLQIDF